ncbi:MAG: hypothetical protein K6E73_12725 [Bacteroidales bacterium]|nr:hypothetical protein [Bacteroidales bacterium]
MHFAACSGCAAIFKPSAKVRLLMELSKKKYVFVKIGNKNLKNDKKLFSVKKNSSIFAPFKKKLLPIEKDSTL